MEQYLLNRAIEISNNLKPSTVYNRDYYVKNRILYARNQLKYIARKQYFDYKSDFDRLGISYTEWINANKLKFIFRLIKKNLI